jgi:hypothetical protein
MKRLTIFSKSGKKKKIDIPDDKAFIITVSFTNRRMAQELKEAGVPLISDINAEDSRKKYIQKGIMFLKRNGVGTHREYPINGIINGSEMLSVLNKLPERETYLRIRQRVTQNGLKRGRQPKYNLKIYFIPTGKADFKDKDGTLKVNDLSILKELVNAGWFIHLHENPQSILFALTSRQPEKAPTLQISLD